MKCVTVEFVVLIGMVLALAGGPALSAANTQIAITSCPYSINAPGRYVIAADLSCVGSGIDISASHVDLDLNGHVITGSTTTNSSSGIYVEGGQTRVHIEGPGLIQNFARGININNVDYARVERVTAAHNSLGFEGTVSHGTIASNAFVANINGGLVAGGADCVFKDNDVSANRNYGMNIGGTNCAVKNNIVNGTTNGPGIMISGSNSMVHSNVTNGNFRAGISVQTTATGAQVFNNISVGNGSNDLEDNNYNGGTTCGTDLWHSNVFFTSGGQQCIH